jgi:hypothetical protein
MIDLRLATVESVIAEVRGAALIVADPPWQYRPGAAGKGAAQPELNGIYNCLSDEQIVKHLDLAYDCAAASARFAVWYTFPKGAEWRAAGCAGPRWGAEVSGGAWLKVGQVGVGYHWRGQVEPVALFTRGATGPTHELLLNGYASRPSAHSEKPAEWMRSWIRAWTKPGDLVLDLYAGRAPLAHACAAEGRDYIGAEADPERHAEAMEGLMSSGLVKSAPAVKQQGMFGDVR